MESKLLSLFVLVAAIVVTAAAEGGEFEVKTAIERRSTNDEASAGAAGSLEASVAVEASSAGYRRGLEFERVVAAASCTQSSNTLIGLLSPCAAAATNPSTTPSQTCCLGVKGVTDSCFCYLSGLMSNGNSGGITMDDVKRISDYCHRPLVLC